MNEEVNRTLVRRELEAGKRITVLSVLNSIGTIEARKYLSDLRKLGMAIKDEWCTSDNGKRFKTYWLETK